MRVLRPRAPAPRDIVSRRSLLKPVSAGGAVWATVDMKKLKFRSNFFLSIVNE